MSSWADLCRELAVRYQLPAGADDRLIALLELLRSDPHAPTSVADPAAAAEVHIADSLSGLEFEPLREASTVADIGSGAGFPGIPLALALPATRFDLIESARRRCKFIEQALEVTGADNASIVNSRAELWAGEHGFERYDCAIVRAVAALPTLVEYGSPLLSTGGMLIAWKGKRDAAEEAAAAAASSRLAMKPLEVRVVTPYEGSRDRHLHVFEKVGPTPDGYPRRAGLAANRPLGS